MFLWIPVNEAPTPRFAPDYIPIRLANNKLISKYALHKIKCVVTLGTNVNLQRIAHLFANAV